MTKQIFKNRWFVQAIILIIITGFGAWGIIEYTNIQMDSELLQNISFNQSREIAKKQLEPAIDTSNWQTYRNEEYGVNFGYPSDWYFDTFGVMKAGGPIELTTLPRSAYGEGGVLPRGGAEINIVKGPSVSIEQTIQKDLVGVEIQSRDNIQVGGEKADRVFYKISFPNGIFQKEIGIYLIHNSALYKIFFTYYENDQKESQFLTTFNTFLSTFKFIEKSVSCAEEIIYTQNPYDGECKKFTNSCQISEEWIKISSCDNPYAETNDLMKDAMEPYRDLPIRTEIIKYETEEGIVDVEIVEGGVNVLFDSKILPETAEKLIVINNGEVIGKIPVIGSYNVKVKSGTVMEFIKKMRKYLVKSVTPDILLHP